MRFIEIEEGVGIGQLRLEIADSEHEYGQFRKKEQASSTDTQTHAARTNEKAKNVVATCICGGILLVEHILSPVLAMERKQRAAAQKMRTEQARRASGVSLRICKSSAEKLQNPPRGHPKKRPCFIFECWQQGCLNYVALHAICFILFNATCVMFLNSISCYFERFHYLYHLAFARQNHS